MPDREYQHFEWTVEAEDDEPVVINNRLNTTIRYSPRRPLEYINLQIVLDNEDGDALERLRNVTT